jgi:2-deoxy-D-gluconate 3-dehydrogenase
MTTPMTVEYANNTEVTAYLMGRVPAARWGVPSDLDPALLFLASPANTFTTGVSITVDGGFCGK